ncbi:hypothetical protein G4Y79_05275 [Phototrophicus methaneseepsis]|uniref:LapA family protein n=1 Tax=Phototrophicus methaneseepsis TaxID=2710758 RepID=A0A7S8EBB4_9CHLR|nr:hypothetical protein [Phototrophicus methaneseepsis]QPC83792.1 hypothetical protein G4Y79_05275 [Phototrophicus methaneseepsis]
MKVSKFMQFMLITGLLLVLAAGAVSAQDVPIEPELISIPTSIVYMVVGIFCGVLAFLLGLVVYLARINGFSVPKDVVNQLADQIKQVVETMLTHAKEEAPKTESPFDDMLASGGEAIWKFILPRLNDLLQTATSDSPIETVDVDPQTQAMTVKYKDGSQVKVTKITEAGTATNLSATTSPNAQDTVKGPQPVHSQG